jgi:hypothetical protein
VAQVTLPHTFQDGVGETASGEEVMDQLNAILAQLNGNVDATNLKDGGVSSSKLATTALNAFLKLLVPGDHKLAYGTTSVPVSGGTSGDFRSTSKVIAHGLGGAPTFVLAVPNVASSGDFNAGSGNRVTVGISPSGSANVNISLVGLTGQTYTVNWLAIR